MEAGLQAYLGASRHIDFDDPQVAGTARRLAQGAGSEADLVRACFEFVRDTPRATCWRPC